MKELVRIAFMLGLVAVPLLMTIPDAFSKTQGAVPAYVVPIAAMKDEETTKGVANAVLVDSACRLLVTNAHVVAKGEVLKILLGDGQWHRAETAEAWISWDVDLAIVQLEDRLTRPLPKPASLKEGLALSKDSVLIITGIVAQTKEGEEEWSLVDYVVEGAVTEAQSGWGITLVSKLNVMEMRLWQLEGKTVPKEKRNVLYENYLLLTREGNVNKFRNGLSGAPGLTEDGGMAGIFVASDASNTRGLMVPVSEVKLLLNKVKRTISAC